MAKVKRDERTASAADRASKSPAQPMTVTHADVSHRAYELYLARGCEHGHDVDDWVQAEGELGATATTA